MKRTLRPDVGEHRGERFNPHARVAHIMNPRMLDLLCHPVTKEPLTLADAQSDAKGRIQSGTLVAPNGDRFPITDGIPRFVDKAPSGSVESFGDEWNYFNFTDFKENWLTHTVANTFGSTDAFEDRLIVDAGGGSGAQTKWFAEYGARHVIMLELSHSVDDVVQRNLRGLDNVDVVQCSIDAPPLSDQSIEGIVYCHNVIQHTPSVEGTARALYRLVAPGGEFVFNCYPTNDEGPIRWIRFHLIYKPLRAVLSRSPFHVIMAYSKAMALIRLIPGLGSVVEKAGLCVQGDVPRVEGETAGEHRVRRFRNTALNTFDYFGSHGYQHHKSDEEILSLVYSLQPDPEKVLNLDEYFRKPPPIGCAIRVFR